MSQNVDTSGFPDGIFVYGVVHPAFKSDIEEPKKTVEPKFYRHKKKPTPSIIDVEAIIYLRIFLWRMRCYFSYYGELFKYGNPDSLQEFDEMLKYGAAYDALWKKYFIDPTKPPEDDEAVADPNTVTDKEAEMWSDLKTLKKVLENDGVIFGFEHRRISGGDMSPRLVRLCNAYDDLRTIWAGTIQAFDPAKMSEKNEHGRSSIHTGGGTLHDSGCFMDRDSYRILSTGYTVGGTRNERMRARPARRRSPSPVHIGWKFSDDYDERQAAAVRQAAIAEAEKKDIEKTTKPDTAVSAKAATKDLKRPPWPVRPKELPTSSPPAKPSPTQVEKLQRPEYGRSPLQQMTTRSMLLREEMNANPRDISINSLGLDSTIINAMAAPRIEKEEVESKLTKKNGLKGWIRGVLGKK